MNKKLILPTTLVLGLIVFSLMSVTYASAQSVTGRGLNNRNNVIQKIAERFNLNESDVEAVFEEERQERFAEMQALWIEKLDDLVNDGKITSDQKQAILDKHEEMHNKMIGLQDLTPEERKEKMQELREEIKAWADEQGIDLSFVGPMGFGKKRGFEGKRFMTGGGR